MKIGRLAAALLGLVLLCTSVAGGAVPEQSATGRPTIALASRVIDTTKAVEPVPETLDVATSPGGDELVLVKFPGPVTAAQLAALDGRAERVFTYLPDDAFLIRMPLGRRQLLADAELGLGWSGPYHPAYKISPALAAVEVAGGRAAGKDQPGAEKRSVLVHVYPDRQLDQVVAEIELMGQGEVVAAGWKTPFSRVRLLMTPAEIVAARDRLARLAEVFWIDLEPRRVLLNDTTAWVAQSGTGGGRRTPVHDHGIRGQNQIVGVLDTGIDPDMCYFRDPDRGLPPRNLCNGGTTVNHNQRKVIAVDFLWSSECAGGISPDEWDTNDHGTHVAGTLAGDDFANPRSRDPGDGLAPGAKLVIQDGGAVIDSCADLPGIGCPVVDLNPVFLQAYRQGARIHSNSWGDDENNPTGGLYSAGAEDADEFTWNHKDFLLVFAAGNSGPGAGTVISPASAKNVVAAGATQRGANAEQMASFSSCGVTADGRIKPDVTMPGTNIVSADADNDADTMNCGVRPISGTSMATPGVAGALALIRQYFTAGWYPTGTARAADALTPSAALMKATLINSGHDMTAAAAIPGACQGWGRALLDDALHFSGQARQLWVEDDAPGFAQGSSGEERSFDFLLDQGSPLKVTLAWTDPASTPAAARNLVNDLDLRVHGPGGTRLGNVFAGGASAPGGSADRLNNVEQVLLPNPAAGTYTVTVRSFNVPDGPQPFALVVTAALSECATDAECDDGVFCNGAETCAAGDCRAGNDPCPGQACDEEPQICVDCLVDADCDDGVGCTVDACDVDANACAHTPDDALCDDGLSCDGTETCDPAAGCLAGTPIDCAGPDVPAGALCVTGDRFCVEARWSVPGGGAGRAAASALTSESGMFWFFHPANVELVVKVLDACFAPWDRFWVFATGLTDVGVELSVVDLATGERVAYTNPGGNAYEPVLDTQAFATCDAGLAAGLSPEVLPAAVARQLEELLAEPHPESGNSLPFVPFRGNLPAPPAVRGSETCTPGPQSLCLNGGRFRVETQWRTFEGLEGSGQAVEITSDTGYFWFFEPDNVEVVVKVLDACVAPWDRFWVFAGGLTNLEVTLRVIDTVSGEVREYHNPLGTVFRPIRDTQAFATCP